MPHAGHFIASQWCQFRLNTYVGRYIVSTVGEYLPDEGVREIFASSRKIKLEGIGDARRAEYMKKIGYELLHYPDILYETMVFRAIKATKKDKMCCPWRIKSGGDDVETSMYKTCEEAMRGHYKLCKKWSQKK